MFLDTNLLEFHKLGASGLQVETTPGLVGDTLLTGTHDEGHEGGRLDLKEEGGEDIMRHVGSFQTVPQDGITVFKPNLQVDRSPPHIGHMCM